MKNDYIGMIATHLNAPYGRVVSADQIRDSLAAGSLAPLEDTPAANAILAGLFVECSPSLIGEACAQAGIDLQHAHDLYKSLVQSHASPAVSSWEAAVKEILC